MLSRLCRVLCAVVLAACAAPPPAAELRWGGDAEGGAPFVEADPTNPSQVRGFDVEIAGLMAQGLGRQPRFTQVGWAAIEQSLARGDFDVGLSGVEDRAELGARFAVSLPYYEFREVLTVRSADTARFRTLDDLAQRRVGTLAATMAYRLLLDAQRTDRVVPVSYDDDVHPYTDLLEGRVDAVLLDHVLAERALRRMPGLAIQPAGLARGHYVALFAKEQTALRDSANVVL
ncbi:ABC transporter substrate-binding protein, partial [Gemmatimonas sp.]|uniref:ABC transporter substrate-binding protein n=1 Tax=Gemmatimonas sp. TaxID=1962908 RepID=UPI0033425075